MKRFLTAAAIVVAALATSACKIEADAGDKAEKARSSTLERAVAQVPPYGTKNFLRRQAVADLMERQDTPEKIWYVYELAEGTGSVLGYYVASTPPIPYCTGMTPPDTVDENGVDNDLLRAAPSLDGVWGGSDCDTRFFFDATTDALIMTQMKLRVLDQPLAGIDAPKLTIATEGGE